MIKKSIQVSAKAGLFFVLLFVLVFSALVLYLKTDHCRKVIIKRVNANIPGSLAWQDLDFSFFKGEVQVAGGELFSRDNDKIAGFDRFFISLDLPRLFDREIVVKKIFLKNLFMSIEQNLDKELNIVSALVRETREVKETSEKKTLPLPDIEIISLEIEDGVFFCKLHQQQFSTELKNISLQASADSKEKIGKLTLNADKGRIISPQVDSGIKNLFFAGQFEKDSILDLAIGAGLDFGSISLKGDIRHIFPLPGSDLQKNHFTSTREVFCQNSDFDLNPDLDLKAEVKGCLDGMADAFRLKEDMSGDVRAEVSISGKLTNPEASVKVDAANAVIYQQKIDQAVCRLALADGQCTATSELHTLGSVLTLSGHVKLQDTAGKIIDNPLMDFDLFWNQIALQRIAPLFLPENQLFSDKGGIHGDLSLKSAIKGRFSSPRADFTFLGENMAFGQEKIASLVLSGAVSGPIEKPLAEVQASAEQVDLAGGSIKGDLTGSVNAHGPLDALLVQGNMRLTHLEFLEQPFTDLTARIQIEDNKARLTGDFNFGLSGHLDLKTKDMTLDLNFDKTELLPWLNLAGVEDCTARLSGRVHAQANADDMDQAEIKADIENLSVVYKKDYQFSLADINAELTEKKLEIPDFRIALPGGGQAVVSAFGTMDQFIDARLKADIPFKTASLFTSGPSGNSSISGFSDFKGAVLVTAQARVLEKTGLSDGIVRLDLSGLGMTLPETMHRLHSINGAVNLKGNLSHAILSLTDINGMLGKGTFAISGSSDIKEFLPDSFDVNFKGIHMDMDMVEDLELVLDTELGLKGDLTHAALKGDVAVVSGVYTRDVDIKASMAEALKGTSRTRKGLVKEKDLPDFFKKISIDLAVKEKSPFIVDNNMAYMEIHPDIRVQGTLFDPVVSGRSEIDPGTFYYQGNEFVLTKGEVDFTSPYAIEPELSLEAACKVRDWDIFLSLEGGLDELDLSFRSDPALEQADIVSLLIRGKTFDELISFEGGTRVSPAGMLADLAASSVEEKIKAAAGLDVFELGVDENGGDSALGDVNMVVGKDLTEHLTLKYITETQDGDLIQKTKAEYRFMDDFSISGFQDTEGRLGGELRYRLEFR
ncbi:MAG: translocation/assembly module TamB domain-containing protein [Thermodesulfobacteriota bacterium]|nr:translocation/assembly module TamB domain-containing protein [Thermodesulfobacteriota bacterium]